MNNYIVTVKIVLLKKNIENLLYIAQEMGLLLDELSNEVSKGGKDDNN